MQAQSFKQRVISSSIWTFGGSVLTQIIRFVSNLIMTRLLAPEMFGLMAVAHVIIFGLNLLSDIGLRQIIIQNKRSDEAFVNTIWTLQVMRGWLIWMLSVVVALIFVLLSHLQFWPEGSVYSEPIFPWIVAVIGFTSVIGGYESTKMAHSTRGLSLKISVSIGLVTQIIGIIVMLIWAYFYPSVWALVVGAMVSTCLSVLSSFCLIKGSNNYFHWDKEVIKEVLHFGKWIFVSSILGFLVSSSDKLILGGLVDAKLVGYYAIAGLLVGAIGQLITSVIHSVGFPALSETYRDNPQKLKSVFYKLRLPFDLFLIFSCGFIYSAAHAIVAIIYDSRYESVAWILQIMAVGLFELRYRMAGECFMAMGKPKLQTSLIFVDLVFLYSTSILAYKFFGFTGIIWAVTCSALSTIPLNLYYLRKFGLLDWRRELIVLPMIVVGYLAGLILSFLVKTFILR
ncbi:MAG: oligosaccharide flippase family protein [Methylophilus sp.]|nr:oligosaccharide flippase family protein [Methylophilus sp.]